jgi:hypothetical protein
MNDFASLLQQGNAWLFVPSAICSVRCMAWNRATQKR